MQHTHKARRCFLPTNLEQKENEVLNKFTHWLKDMDREERHILILVTILAAGLGLALCVAKLLTKGGI